MTKKEFLETPNSEKVKQKINLVYALSEIQFLYLKEVERELKMIGLLNFGDKFLINSSIASTKKVVDLVRNVTSKEFSEKYEIVVDELKYEIDKMFKL